MEQSKKNKDAFWLGLGIVYAILLCLPFLMLGEDAVITYHDQLDGEMITYLLNAKHLLDHCNTYPEVMNGIPKNGLISPAPLYVLFYKALPPFWAFMCGMLLNKLVQFSFAYLLIKKLTGRSVLGFFTGIWFASLPFYSVYGLCIPGQPMLYYGFLGLWKQDEKAKRSSLILPICLIVFYAAASSLALCGFACLILLFGLMMAGFFLGKRRAVCRTFLGLMAMGAVYALCNLSLLKQLLPFFHADFVTHKTEILAHAVPFWETFFTILLQGEDYCNGYGVFSLPVILVAVGVCAYRSVRKRTGEEQIHDTKSKGALLALLGIVLLIVFWRAFYQSEGVVALRNRSTGVWHDFNFGRFTWLLPFLWCLCFAFAGDVILTALEQRQKQRRLALAAGVAILALSAALPAFSGMYAGDLKPNVVKLLRHGDYYMMTWRQFFAKDLFDEVDALIGRPKEEYRVVSLGIYPAAAAYNGFYCLDAYSNNYDVEYKHQFGRVIRPQLDKNAYLKEWFDGWGNRCYLVLAEFGSYFTFEKRWGSYTKEYTFDWEALKEMGGSYLISAVYLVDSEQNGLRLLNEEPIQTQGSWYRLWVYEVE